ncbi:MAG TPA: POTRA domain-containing protein [Bauldia sp.]|nr:POTRA domain-containing protein [Bauldia sp.]
MGKWLRCVVGVGFAVLSLSEASAAPPIPSSEEPGRQQQRFLEQPAPKAKPAGSVISLPTAEAPPGAASITLVVNDIHIVGASVYSAAELQPLYIGIVGHQVALAAIYDLAQKITARYGKDGYVLSRAIVPPQDLDPKGAVVTIRVVEGYVDRVEWPPLLQPYRDFFSDYAAKITAERPANIKTITRYLLLAGDLPGIGVTSTFTASTDNSGASTLVVKATERPLNVDARIDNRGTEARGPWEFLTSATINNLFRQHEAFTATYAAAVETNELQYVALGYRQVLSSEGLTTFADGNYSWGRPGTAPLVALDFASQSLSADAGLSFPVLRSREKNLTLAGLVFLSNDEGDILATPNTVDRLRGVRLKADFDSADSLNGANQGSVVFSRGIEGLGSTENGSPLASRANGRVDFAKIEGTVSRVQPVTGAFSVRLAAQGQVAFTPLLAPEECGYGGKEFGRAFDPSEITGDSCLSVNAEVRYDLPDAPNPFFNQGQIYAYLDYGAVERLAPTSGVPSTDTGASAGVGLRLARTGVWIAEVSADKPISGRADGGWRFFATLSTPSLASAAAQSIGTNVKATDFSWRGPYLGVQAGYDWSHAVATSAGMAFPADTAGGLLGLYGGYNFQSGHLVYGIDGTINLDSTRGSFAGVPTANSSGSTWKGSLRGRLGVGSGNILAYATAGLTAANWQIVVNPVFAEDAQLGWTVGGGVELALAPHLTSRIDYTFERYSTFNEVVMGMVVPTQVAAQTVTAGIALKY